MMFAIYEINRGYKLHRKNTAWRAEVLRWNVTIQTRNDLLELSNRWVNITIMEMTEKVQAGSDSYKKERKKADATPGKHHHHLILSPLPTAGLLGKHPLFSLPSQGNTKIHEFALPDTINTILSHLCYIFFICGGLLRSFLVLLPRGSKAGKYCFRSAVMLQPYFQSNALISSSPHFWHYSHYISNV